MEAYRRQHRARSTLEVTLKPYPYTYCVVRILPLRTYPDNGVTLVLTRRFIWIAPQPERH
jgi:hypothetical protein